VYGNGGGWGKKTSECSLSFKFATKSLHLTGSFFCCYNCFVGRAI